MNLFGLITTLPLWRGTSVLELIGMVGVETSGPIASYANVGAFSSVF